MPEKQQPDRGAYEENFEQPGYSIKALLTCGKSFEMQRAHTEIKHAVKDWVRPTKRPGESNHPTAA